MIHSLFRALFLAVSFISIVFFATGFPTTTAAVATTTESAQGPTIKWPTVTQCATAAATITSGSVTVLIWTKNTSPYFKTEWNIAHIKNYYLSILCFNTLLKRMTKTFSIHRNRRGERLRDPKSFIGTTRPRPAQWRRHAAWQSLPRQHRRSLRSTNGWKTFG